MIVCLRVYFIHPYLIHSAHISVFGTQNPRISIKFIKDRENCIKMFNEISVAQCSW